MNVLSEVSKGSKKAFSIQNILFMTITTIIVTLIISRFLKNEIVIYDTYGKITGYGDIQPKLKAPKFKETK